MLDHLAEIAHVTSRDENDLMLKAAAGCIYDKVRADYQSVAVISYSVTLDLLKLRMPAQA
jgi:hypothetical protein